MKNQNPRALEMVRYNVHSKRYSQIRAIIAEASGESDTGLRTALKKGHGLEWDFKEDPEIFWTEDSQQKAWLTEPVSYTHLDVYKRQFTTSRLRNEAKSSVSSTTDTEPETDYSKGMIQGRFGPLPLTTGRSTPRDQRQRRQPGTCKPISTRARNNWSIQHDRALSLIHI